MTPAEGMKNELNNTREEVSESKSVVLISPFVPPSVQGAVPKFKLEPLQHQVIIPEEGETDPATGKKMCQMTSTNFLPCPATRASRTPK